MNLTPQRFQVPIVVAVTGHRDLRSEDVAALSQSVSQQFQALGKRFPHCPFVLLSGLAEGADRLVARCALDAGWTLGAALPLSQADYEQDFAGPGSVDEFRELLGRAAWVCVVPSASQRRPDCYDALSEWLANRAHFLIALWDGQPGRGAGGTAEVVRRFREGVIQDRLVPPDTGPVMHVHVHRSTALKTADPIQAEQVTLLPARPAGLGEMGLTSWHAALERIDQFNADVSDLQRQGLLSELEGSPALQGPAGSHNGRTAAASRSLFLVADAMAIKAQRERMRMFKGLLWAAAGAVVLSQVYSSLFTFALVLCGALVLSCMAIGWYRFSGGGRLEQRYLDYRALAEACKVQYFWCLVGVQDPVTRHYLREQIDELEWLRLALRSLSLGETQVGIQPSSPGSLSWVRDAWLEDQRRYFLGDGSRAGKAQQNRRLDDLWSRRSRWLAGAGAVLMMLTAAFHLFIADLTLPHHDWALRILLVSYSIVFGTAGLCKVYQQTSAFAEHAKKYQRAGQMLQIALSRIDAALAAGDLPAAVEVLRSFGIEALAENGDWLMLHRDRPAAAQGFG